MRLALERPTFASVLLSLVIGRILNGSRLATLGSNLLKFAPGLFPEKQRTLLLDVEAYAICVGTLHCLSPTQRPESYNLESQRYRRAGQIASNARGQIGGTEYQRYDYIQDPLDHLTSHL